MRVPAILRKPTTVLVDQRASSVEVEFAGLDKQAADALHRDIDAQLSELDHKPAQPRPR